MPNMIRFDDMKVLQRAKILPATKDSELKRKIEQVYNGILEILFLKLKTFH